jgi:hypothetical protein
MPVTISGLLTAQTFRDGLRAAALANAGLPADVVMLDSGDTVFARIPVRVALGTRGTGTLVATREELDASSARWQSRSPLRR